MKILILSNLYPPHYVGGYELQCQSVAEAMRGRGHRVQVLTSDHGLDRDETTITERGTRRSLRIHGMFGHPWLGIHKLFAQEQQNNQTLVATIRQFQPDVVYVWNMSGLSKSILFTLQDLDIPTVFALCDHWIARSATADVWTRWWNRKDVTLRHRLLRALWTVSGARRRCQRQAPTNPVHQLRFQRIHFCSRSLRDFTARAGFNVSHGAVIYNSVDTTRFRGQPAEVGRPLLHLLYVGRLTEEKGVMTAVSAISAIRDKFAGHLHIYGRGEDAYEKELKERVQREKLPVTFSSISHRDEMPAIYTAHDALIFPSEWEEPFAITPLEAMACGLPVIGTLTGGSAELFRHGQNALTYPAGNHEELARRILEFDQNPVLRRRIAVTGQEEIRARFSEPVIMDQVEQYLRDAIAHWRPTQALDYAA